MLLLNALDIFCNVLVWILVIRAILSWFVNPYQSNPNSTLYKINAFIISFTEPIVRPFRKLLSKFNTGPVDFSIFVAILAIMVVERVVLRVAAMMIF